MDDHDHDYPDSTEREVAIAERALAEGDPVHAAHHVANALFDTAGDGTYLDLARRVLEASSVDRLVGPDERNDRKLLLRAVLLHLSGRDAEATRLLAKVADYCRELPLERWLALWIRDARETLDPDAFEAYLRMPTRTTVGRVTLRASEVRYALDLSEVADALLEREDTGHAPAILMNAASLYRRAGRTEDALRIAEQSVAADPNGVSLSMLALAKRSASDHEGARVAFDRAKGLDGDAREAEFGRTAWWAGDLESAVRHFERARDGCPDDSEMDVCVEWLRHATGSRAERPGFWQRMSRAARRPTPPVSDESALRGAEHEARVGRPLRPDDAVILSIPWVGWLPEPSDASIASLRQLGERRDPIVHMRLSHLEAPSARLAVAWTSGADDAAAVSYEIERIPEAPDPRFPWDEVPFVLWRFEDEVPYPALPVPGDDVRRAVAELATLPFHLPRWWDEAARLGASIGPARVRELAATMVHGIREAPEGVPPWVWLQKQQIASALLIARVEPRPKAEGPAWLTLEAILCGPSDWAVEAAIIAASELAFDHPHVEPLVRATFVALLDHTPREGFVGWHSALTYVLPRLPRTGRFLEDRCAREAADT